MSRPSRESIRSRPHPREVVAPTPISNRRPAIPSPPKRHSRPDPRVRVQRPGPGNPGSGIWTPREPKRTEELRLAPRGLPAQPTRAPGPGPASPHSIPGRPSNGFVRSLAEPAGKRRFRRLGPPCSWPTRGAGFSRLPPHQERFQIDLAWGAGCRRGWNRRPRSRRIDTPARGSGPPGSKLPLADAKRAYPRHRRSHGPKMRLWTNRRRPLGARPPWRRPQDVHPEIPIESPRRSPPPSTLFHPRSCRRRSRKGPPTRQLGSGSDQRTSDFSGKARGRICRLTWYTRSGPSIADTAARTLDRKSWAISTIFW